MSKRRIVSFLKIHAQKDAEPNEAGINPKPIQGLSSYRE